jgi:hypothetical protein
MRNFPGGAVRLTGGTVKGTRPFGMGWRNSNRCVSGCEGIYSTVDSPYKTG